jgi:hypothetical protein
LVGRSAARALAVAATPATDPRRAPFAKYMSIL